MTEYQKLIELLAIYERILHPDIFLQLKKQLQAANDENKREAFIRAKISDEAIEIEKKLNYLRKQMVEHERFPDVKRFHIKCFYKEILDLLNK
jgi:hypothetical protein